MLNIFFLCVTYLNVRIECTKYPLQYSVINTNNNGYKRFDLCKNELKTLNKNILRQV